MRELHRVSTKGAGSTKKHEHKEPGVPGAGCGPGLDALQRASGKTRGEGVGKALTGEGNPTDRPTDRPAPPAARMPDRAHTLSPRRSQRAAATPARPGGPGSLAGDPRPGHTGDGRRALGVSPSTCPRGAGDARRRGHGDRPAGDRPGTQPALGRAHLSGWARRGEDHESSPSSSTRRRRRTGGGETGSGSGPRRAREARHTRARPRGAADGERTEADGQTEKGTDGVRPREANATERAVEAGWPRATARGRAQGDPWAGETRVSRRGPPRDLTARGLPAQGRSHGTPGTTDWRPRHPHGGSRPPPPTHTREPQPAGENALPPRTGVPHGPHTRNPAVPGSPPCPLSQGSEGTALPGEATGGRRPRDDTHVRRGRLDPRQGKGTLTVARAGRGGRPAAAGTGRKARTAGAVRRPENTGTRPGRQENQRGIPTPLTQEGGPETPGTPAGPGHPQSGPPRPGPAARSDPEAQHPGDTLSSEAAQTVPARRHRLCDRLLLTTAAGLGKLGTTGRRAPHPFPLGSHTAHTCPHTCRTPVGAQQDPPPNSGVVMYGCSLEQQHVAQIFLKVSVASMHLKHNGLH
ncbi:collagen alpha-1(III) chain-like [Bubalus bubalis]|uniref:collagen alpha-1(III) chain-like n=1 Tax=Bubalus bubalis TaxID=89462 RepID=UPI001E1B6964|nr:collagen alpha-1(III) chain-like [Bubalus bubalis]